MTISITKKHQLYFKIIFVLIIFTACKNEKFEDLKFENAKLKKEIKEKKPKKIIKYVFAKYQVKSPRIETKDIDAFTMSKYSLVWDVEIYTTDIAEIQDYNPDSKYVFLDKMEKVVSEKLRYKDMSLTSRLIYLEDIEKYENFESKIIDQEFFEYDSYKEASISRRESITFN